ncbi:hypothetical protein UY3_14984 [Chelonia mydas]|uniref:Uncharacterized protein n=1 Tax=Chelonia mydas TaxID=8469 RepID=M7AXX3_CHEMY|nr:hypothetical protein UY3_14984 [Chelonia mydas]
MTGTPHVFQQGHWLGCYCADAASGTHSRRWGLGEGLTLPSVPEELPSGDYGGAMNAWVCLETAVIGDWCRNEGTDVGARGTRDGMESAPMVWATRISIEKVTGRRVTGTGSNPHQDDGDCSCGAGDRERAPDDLGGGSSDLQRWFQQGHWRGCYCADAASGTHSRRWGLGEGLTLPSVPEELPSGDYGGTVDGEQCWAEVGAGSALHTDAEVLSKSCWDGSEARRRVDSMRRAHNRISRSFCVLS